jgi:F-type H+-transporting ATPase subunit b
MEINWFTVAAQVLNFFVLVWLLKRFLYKPVLAAIDERENKITSELKDADAKKAEALKQQDEFKQKNETFDEEKKGLMEKAVAETNIERQKLLDEARKEADALRMKQEASLNEMKENLNLEISQKTQNEVFSIARKTLSDLASVSLEEQSVYTFIQRLKGLQNEERQQFVDAFHSANNSILIQSAFDLSEPLQNEIKNTVNEILSAAPSFEFKTAPALISGIELSANGYKLAWTIAEYLNSVQKSISETMDITPETVEENK